MKYKIGDRIELQNYGKGTIVLTDTSKTNHAGYDILVNLDVKRNCFFDTSGKDANTNNATCRFFFYYEIMSKLSKSNVEIYY